MTAYTVFRPHHWNLSLRERIAAAVAAYRGEHGTPPAGLAVHPREVDAARQVVADLGLALEVRAVGGCLVPEVWLIMDGTDVRKKEQA